MRSTLKRVVVTALVGCFLAVWGAHTDRDVIAAQARTRMPLTRLYTGPDGQTHAEEIDVNLMPSGEVGALRSQAINVTGLQFGRNPAHYFHDWHTAPHRQYAITLSGREEIEIAGGKQIEAGPGHILLAEDTTGKGHISRGVGTEDRIVLFITLPDK
jgi:quercetin dioxygenase-like cupin family protein